MPQRPVVAARRAVRRLAAAGLLCACLAACWPDRQPSLDEAKRLLAQRQTDQALLVLKSALQQSPDNLDARLLLSRALLAAGQGPAAQVELERLQGANYPERLVLPEMARAMLAQGQHRKVADLWAGADLGDAATTADLQTSVAKAQLALGEPEASRAALLRALTADAGYVPAQLMQARLDAESGAVAQAQQRAQAVLEVDPKAAEAWVLLGDVAARGAQLEQAASLYGRALAMQPDLVQAHVALVALHMSQRQIDAAKAQLAAMRKALPNHPQTVLLDGQVAYQAGDLRRADEQFQRLLRAAPDNVLLLQSAGAVALRQQAHAQAERLLGRALQLAPERGHVRRLLAESLLATGQAPRALAVLAPLLAPESTDAQAMALAAQARLAAGDVPGAQALFQRMAALKPSDARLRTVLALSQLTRGQNERAVAELQAVADSDVGVGSDIALVTTHLRARQWDAALAAVAALDRKQPGLPQAPMLRGQVQLARQDRAAARQAFQEALARAPQHLPAVSALAALDLAAHRPDAAKARFTAFLQADPGNSTARLAMVDLMRRGGAGRDTLTALLDEAAKASPADLAVRLAQVGHHLATGQPQAAVAAAQAGLASLPDAPDLLQGLGQAQRLTGELQQAATSFNRLIALQPQSPLGYQGLAEVQMTQKDLAGAGKTVRRGLEAVPQTLALQQLGMQAALRGKQPLQALAMARNVQAQRPDEAIGWLLEAEVALAQQQWETALAPLRQALTKAAPAQAPARLHLALQRAGQAAAAQALASSWPQAHPDDALFLFYLGDQALTRRDWSEAQRFYAQVLRLQPDHGLALNNTAWALLQQRKPGALAYADRAAKALPDQPAVLDTLASALGDAGRWLPAVEVANRAVALAPDEPTYGLNLARLQAKAGLKREALELLDKLAALGDAFAGHDEVRALIAALGPR